MKRNIAGMGRVCNRQRQGKENNSPAPDICAMFRTIVFFHPSCDINILRAMVTAYPTRYAMKEDVLKEKVKNRGSTIVVIGSYAGDKTRVPIDEGVYDDTPATQT